ncbi:CBS domain-containing protein, partial [Rhodospirillales bacterium]|nr:CBS domain-containing protein [Rhodospirillales bacterium]
MNEPTNGSQTPGQEITTIEVEAETTTETNGRSVIFKNILRGLKKLAGGNGSARDTLEELIDERDEGEVPLDSDERLLLANILALRKVTIYDVMVPRADIVSIPCSASLQEVIEISTKEGHSRLPVYTDSLDDAQGMVHIKDVVRWRGKDDTFKISDIQRKLLFVAPSMRVLELLLEMRVKRSHMAL